MKLTIAGIVIVGVVLGVTYFIPSTQTVFNERVVQVPVEVTPDWAEDADAVQAAKDVIRRKELEAELEVLTQEVQERESRIVEIEKELGTY